METRLDLSDLARDPLEQFGRWFEAARAANTPQPEAIALATASSRGAPSLRIVLLKRFDERGFAFFTHLDSRKARELAGNPRAALLAFWQPLGRQVRIEGSVTPVNREEAEHYARSRSRDSQLSALASPQSSPVESREWLEQRVRDLDREHPGDPLPVSERWGGFTLAPSGYEFWQNGEHRLHDRFAYHPAASGGWAIERLGP
ncbi:MAG: pyridoxamine 5'-phosphate oxidase [Thermoleophilaceae bacterium]|nr:pyridoxamine 5'-phosphate oxidase [Thermoleophilaceae bacterium]